MTRPATTFSTVLLTLALAFAPAQADPAPASTPEEETRRIVAEMMADAQARSSLLRSEAGRLDGKFRVRTRDEAFDLSLRTEMQFRYASITGADDDEQGFQMRRLRFDVRGHALSPKLEYRVRSNFSRSTGRLGLLDAYAQYDLGSGWSLRGGQYLPPFTREFATSPTALMTVERSLVDEVFRINRSQGVQLGWEGERWRLNGSFSDGRVALNTDFDDPREADAALTLRAEHRFGDATWSELLSLPAFRGQCFGGMLGAAVHWQREADALLPPGASGTSDLLAYTADVSFEGDGWSLFAVFAGRNLESSDTSLNDFGLSVQGGAFVTDHVHLYAEYAHLFPDHDREGGDDQFRSVGAGVNYYPFARSLALRVTAEVRYALDDQAASASVLSAPRTGRPLLADADEGQLGVILQLQLIF